MYHRNHRHKGRWPHPPGPFPPGHFPQALLTYKETRSLFPKALETRRRGPKTLAPLQRG